MFSQRGIAAPLVAVFTLITFAITALVFWLGIGVALRAQAQGVADMAALAGASFSSERAKTVALENKAKLVSYETKGEQFVARIKLGNVFAFATAQKVSERQVLKFAPAINAAIARVEMVSGRRVVVVARTSRSVTISSESALWFNPAARAGGLCAVSPESLTFMVCR